MEIKETPNELKNSDFGIIKKSFAAIKQDMDKLKKEIFEIKKAVFFDQSSVKSIAEKLDVLNNEFYREKSNSEKALNIINKINLSRKELKDEQLNAGKIVDNLKQLSYLKKELHDEQLQAQKAIKKLHKNFDSIHTGIESCSREIGSLHNGDSELRAQIGCLENEAAQNRHIMTEALKNIFGELAEDMRNGVLDLATVKNFQKNPKTAKNQERENSGKAGKVKLKKSIKNGKKAKNFFSKVGDFFAEESDP